MKKIQPNILFLMVDQFQAAVLRPNHPCQTPHLKRLAEGGVRFDNAYTPNAICSPARASLMTGLLPHSHGVLTVTHCVDDDQSVLRDRPHWAQRLSAAGYRTGYFGKWHVERSEQLDRFGWQHTLRSKVKACDEPSRQKESQPVLPRFSHVKNIQFPPGHKEYMLYGVTNQLPEQRKMGTSTSAALEYLETVLLQDAPWCCFVSLLEPHDPFVAGEKAFSLYDVDRLPLASNASDTLAGRPGLYRKAAQIFADMSDHQKREAAACYYASITEIDAQYGRLITKLEKTGELENTIVVFTSDHGELLGAHGLYCKNVGAFEEVYNIPLILAGPGLARGQVSKARVGLHDLCPTLLELAGLPPIGQPDSRSFAAAAKDPANNSKNFTTGYAEYSGTRYSYTQRIAWDGPWKFVLNGFDFDELYNLEEDPHELQNLAGVKENQEHVKHMMKLIWRRIRETGDHTLLNTDYPAVRLAPYGPGIE